MEGSGRFMLIGRDKQSEGEEGIKSGANASPSASPNKKWATD